MYVYAAVEMQTVFIFYFIFKSKILKMVTANVTITVEAYWQLLVIAD